VVEERTWEEFRKSGLLWWVNRSLHLFGWSIVLEINEGDSVSKAYPARVKFRGFAEKNEEEGFINLTKHIAKEMPELLEEIKANGN
jgi:hypothetical protein